MTQPLTMKDMQARAGAISPPEFIDPNALLPDYTARYVLAVQNVLPIYLTSGCCESAHGSPEIFEALGLPHGWYSYRTGKMADSPEGFEEGDFYPLTDAESNLIGEDSAVLTPKCEARLPYALLYKGQKWIAPHICFHFGGKGEQSEAEAREQFDAHDALIREKIESVGGVLVRSENDEVEHGCNEEDGTHALIALLPIPFVQSLRGDLDWKGYVEAMDKFLGEKGGDTCSSLN